MSTTTNNTGKRATKINLKPRDTSSKKRGVTTSTATAVVEIADAFSEGAEAIRRTLSLANIALKELQGDMYFDAIATLTDKGLTTEQAMAYYEAL